MNRTGIEWTDFSANPLKYRDDKGRVVWGCVHASAGCLNCYAEALAKRYDRGGPFAAHVMKGLTPFLDEAELRHMLTAKRIGGMAVAGGKCFVGDMTDIFGEWVPDELLNRLFSDVLERRQDVTWQLLTKRADRMRRYLSWRWGEGRIPSRNVWLGTSVEDQGTADERIPLLLRTPAATRFVSYEPGLGGIDWRKHLTDGPLDPMSTMGTWPALDWVIVGGESGIGARPFDLAWARSTVEQCKAAGVAVFVKQFGSRPVDEDDAGDEPRQAFEDRPADPVPLRLRDRKGGDPSEWPEDLRVREFPA